MHAEPRLSSARVQGDWSGKSAGGCKNHATCPNNPQFLLQVTSPTNTHLLLTQTERTDFDHIGFYIAKTCTHIFSSLLTACSGVV